MKIGDKLYLDGGLSDSVPIMHSIVDGNRKNIVVLTNETRATGRKPSGHLGLVKVRYARYPKVYELMANRHVAYNRMLDYLDAQTANGQAFVIRPKRASGIGRIEKDKEKLRLLMRRAMQMPGSALRICCVIWKTVTACKDRRRSFRKMKTGLSVWPVRPADAAV